MEMSHLKKIRFRHVIIALAVLPLLGLLVAHFLFRVAPDASDHDKKLHIAEFYDISRIRFAGIDEISAMELITLKESKSNNDVVLIDVRTSEEQEVSMLPGAIKQAEFIANQERYRDKQVVTYCTIGYRSGMFAKKLHEENWQVANLKGSILSWCHAGGKLVSGPVNQRLETKRVHIYSKQWNLLPKGYQAVW